MGPFGIDLNLEGVAEKFGGLTKEGLEELNANLRAANRIKAAELVLNSEESYRTYKKEAMDTLVKLMRGEF